MKMNIDSLLDEIYAVRPEPDEVYAALNVIVICAVSGIYRNMPEPDSGSNAEIAAVPTETPENMIPEESVSDNVSSKNVSPISTASENKSKKPFQMYQLG